MARKPAGSDAILLLLLTAAALGVHGYHLGVEDQAIYLPAIKWHLSPSLYPYDAAYFLVHTQATLLDEFIAALVKFTGLPVDWLLLGLDLASFYFLLYMSLLLGRKFFREERAAWAGVAMMAAIKTIPVAGTLVLLTSQYLHARSLATPLLLLAMILAREQPLRAGLCVVVAALFHPTMALAGAFHATVQVWPRRKELPKGLFMWLAILPAVWLPASGSASWMELVSSRRHLFPSRWTWYELLGAVAPMALLWWFSRLGRREKSAWLDHVCSRLAISGSLGVAGALLISVTPGMLPLVPAEPMRVLHMVYLVLFLAGGGLIGQYILRNQAWRWALLFVPLCAGMYSVQRQQFEGSPHIEWPGRVPRNAWVEAFEWARLHTPRDALFALDPQYMARPGEDFHGFRGFSERSMLADGIKDRAVAIVYADTERAWRQEAGARTNWQRFTAEDFARLGRTFGASWAVVETGGAMGLACPFSNGVVNVCRIGLEAK